MDERDQISELMGEWMNDGDPDSDITFREWLAEVYPEKIPMLERGVGPAPRSGKKRAAAPAGRAAATPRNASFPVTLKPATGSLPLDEGALRESIRAAMFG